MAVGVTFESTQKSPLAMAVGLLDLGNRRYGRGSRSRINSRRLVQTNASQTSGGDSSSSSSGNEDDGMSMASEPGAMDWRTFRAKLVASNEATRSISSPSPAQEAVGLEIWQDRMSLENWALLASQNPRLAKEVPWVHSTGGAEAGGVLLAAPFPQGPGLASEGRQVPGAGGLDQRLWQAAVFLVEHGASGGESWGLMLNRPSGYTIQKALAQTNQVEDAALTVFARNAIYIGGFKSDGRTLHFLHGHDLPGAKEVMPGVFLGGLEAAAEQVLMGNMPPTDFRFFVGRLEWQPGKLQEEVDAGLWYTAACARSLVLKQCLQLPKPLWREMLELMGGEYAEAARKEFGDSI
ncbi:hypothetical protein CLOP_g20005 [Closterium sp. NIES-67]|nr:hypothetical protein CLOP_g20005 [Closterium sp. NIES-67]